MFPPSNIYVFNNVRNTQFSMWIINIVTTSAAFIYFNTVRIKHGSITVNSIVLGLALHS